ncbi:MAG: nucleotide pyrophosphohydrolase [Proteobacteria bacterium]|nr:nucleotide pyrophosphohydrolase [Pseudomonadota bacterium]
MSTDKLKALEEHVKAFVAERDWDQFHSPKNLAMAMSVEAAEVTELFQWLTEAESRALPPEKLEALKDELADVFVYLLRLSQKFDLDLVACAEAKMKKNAIKYPAAKARGKMTKYTEL